jgi:hypothetical protein
MAQQGLDNIQFDEGEGDLTVDDFTFVMASSRNHFEESLDAVASIQEHFLRSRIIFFDWNLKASQREEIRRWCRVELRDFGLKQTPTFAQFTEKVPRYQSMKIVAVSRVMVETPYVVWVDASVRFRHGDMQDAIDRARRIGILFLSDIPTHSTFAVTDPRMYAFLPTNVDAQKRTRHVQTTSFILVNKEHVFRHVVWWWLLCAFEKSCIAPNENVNCTTSDVSSAFDEFLGCHRVDQSAANILVSNVYDFDHTLYLNPSWSDLIKIERFESMKLQVKVCHA